MENEDKPDKKYENLDDALGEFDENDKLNLTGGDKEGKPRATQTTSSTPRSRRSTRSS